MTLSLYDALLATPPSQSEPLSPSAYLNTSDYAYATATPTQASYLSVPTSSAFHHQPSSSSTYNSTSSRLSLNSLQHLEQLDALDLARSTYHELVDWMSDLAIQAQSMNVNMNLMRERDRENAYLLRAEIRRVHAALIQQAEIVKDLQRVVDARYASSSSRSSSSASSPLR